MRIVALVGVLFGLFVLSPQSFAATKKVVFLAGKKSHGPRDHEYEKACRLLAHCLETSSNAKGFKTEIHLYGWPEDPRTLDDADCIVVYSDGADHNESDHPLLVGDRMKVVEKQMKRGCGLVLLHYSTITPVKRTEFLDWVGGHFDYETGSAPNHWASAIKFCDSNPAPAAATHPICRGVSQFSLREEYYYKIRLRATEKDFAPILNVSIPGELQPQTVAWAYQRKDKGRGFATTCGHPYSNFLDDNFRRVLLNGIVWSAKGDVPKGGVQSTVDPDYNDIQALILTGHAHPAHDWKATTAALSDVLGKDSRIKVTVWEDPEKLATDDLFKFDLLIQNYQNWERPTLSDRGRANLLRFVREGKGLILIHFADGSWREWPDYAGRLSRRVWIDGKSNHDPFGPFRVHIVKPDHLLTAGIPDFNTTDELYYNQQGELPIEPLISAKSKITNRDEPLAYVCNEGKGRIFQTLLGHAAESVSAPGNAEMIRRAAAWVANREVLPLPVSTTPTAITPALAPPRRSTADVGLDPRGRQFNAGGKMTAIDMNKGEFAWQTPLGEFSELTARGVPKTGTENFGGTIVTAGSLVSVGGTKDEKFHAFDQSTGKPLWDYKLPVGGYATPCTYMVNGKQYVVIACSGGGKLNTKSGDSYVAFALP
jgi:type 1 glutamine amidotransferase